MIQPRKYIPREYGQLAADFLYRTPYAALWAKPGMGKTAITYSLLDMLKLAGSNYFPALVIAPKAVCELTWPVEQQKWSCFKDLRVVSLLGTKPQREKALLQRGDIYIINYDNVQWLVQRLGANWPFRILILDESTKVKGYRLVNGSKRSSALGQLVDKFGRVVELSGTPSPNGLKDLWGQIFFLDMGQRLGASYSAFLARWFYTCPYTGDVKPRQNAEAEIYAAIADITLSLRPEDWFDIDQPLFFERRIELTPEVQKQYDKLETEFFLQVGEDCEIDALNAMALSTKLLQVASGTVYDNDGATVPIHDAKIESLKSIIEESGGEPVLTVYQYRSQIAALQAAIPGTRVFKGKQDQDDWNAGKVQHMLIHPQSAGHGVDLQDGGRTMVFFTGTWNLEHRLQVIERIGPMRQIQSGHPRAVMIYDIIASGTLDESVLSRMHGKASIQEALMIARRAVRA